MSGGVEKKKQTEFKKNHPLHLMKPRECYLSNKKKLYEVYTIT